MHKDDAKTLREEVEAITNACLDRIRQHPFIVDAGTRGLSREQAERWIKCAGRESRSFPHILTNMLETDLGPIAKEVLEENLSDEYGAGNPEHAHFKHYLDLLDDLSIPRASFFGYEEGPGIRLALSIAYNVSKSRNLGVALGYMVVNEGMTPITYGAAHAALSRYHSRMKNTFFDIHVAIDMHHVAQLYRGVEELPDSAFDDIRFGVLLGERGMAALLDEAYGLFDYCPELPAYEAAVEAPPRARIGAAH